MNGLGPGASRRWLLHRAHVLRGDWHVHTQLSSGYSSVDDCCRMAVERGLEVIAITERVDTLVDDDFAAVVEAVDVARRNFPSLAILLGCEAAVRDVDGTLDVSDDILSCCDIVLAGIHDFSQPGLYVPAILNMLRNPRVDVWAHPTLYSRRQGISLRAADIDRILDCCRDEAVLMELNARHQLPTAEFLEAASQSGVTVVSGSDARYAREVGGHWPPSFSLALNASSTSRELTW